MKWLIRSALAFALVVAIAALALVMIPTERIARLAADRFGAATGRALTLGGPVEATLWPSLGVRAEGIEIANAPWSETGPMLTADTLEVGIGLGVLFGGDIRIETLEVTGARLSLERRADGTGNWEIEGPAPASTTGAEAEGGDGGRGISVDSAVLTGADVLWSDAMSGTDLHLRAVDLATRLDGLDDPVRVTVSALMEGQPLTLEATAEALRPLVDGTLTPVTLTFDAGETSLGLDGRADIDPPSFEGQVELKSGDRLALLAMLGIAPPDLPAGLGAERIGLAAAVTLAPAGTLHLRDMVAELDDNRLTGELDIDMAGPRPHVTGTLAADSLDLTAFSSEGPGDDGAAMAAEQGWGRTPLDVSGLFAVDGEITFSSGPITLGDAILDELRARATIENGRAAVVLQPLLAYGGTVTGEVVVNARGGLSTRAALELSGLQMQPLLTEFADFDRLIGQADAFVELLGVGTTAQALVDSLSGTVALGLGQGELSGLDIGGMVRNRDLNFRGEGQKTVFDGFSASFAVADGVATGDDLMLEAPYLVSSGAGDIDLGARTMDYRLIPSVRAEEDGRALSVPILFSGPWDDLNIRPDLEYLARERLAEETAELEARARDEARSRLAEELEVDPQALDSREGIEGAIVDRVQDQLLDLLGRR